MLISREMDYALRIIRALSRSGCSASRIAGQEMLSRPMALKVLKKLKQAQIVESIRGQDGGYSLCQGWEDLTFYDLFTALEEDLLISRCQKPGYRCECQPEGCQFCEEFGRIQSVLNQELKRTPLGSILQEHSSQKENLHELSDNPRTGRTPDKSPEFC